MNELKSSEFILLLSLYVLIAMLWIELEYNVILLLLPLIFYLTIEAIIIIKKIIKRREINE